MPIQIGRDLGKKVGIAARLDNKTKAQFAEEALEPVVAATFKRHGLKV